VEVMPAQAGKPGLSISGSVGGEELGAQVALAGAGQDRHDEFAPEEMPQRMPSFLATSRAVSKAASLLTGMTSSMSLVRRPSRPAMLVGHCLAIP